ncbi:sensor histidine kinase [Cupriavidus sp. 2TAF22]|uniref:sensor histidine kinase n=1 Tax=unclassified Cupriavidus TaxID=2640874 RepID=UPI003F91D1FD
MSQQHSPSENTHGSGDAGQSGDSCAPGEVSSSAEVASLIAQVAHDLRSALNGVQSWAYVLDHTLETPPTAAQRALAGIRTGMLQQIALIEHMEEAVALLADESAPQWEQVDLRAALDTAMDATRPVAEGRSVLLRAGGADAPLGAAPLVIDADPRRLLPLLRHLLVHCIRQARTGDAVEARLEREADQVKLRITESRTPSEARKNERISVLSDFFHRRRPVQGGAGAPRQGTALMVTRRLVETHCASIEAVGQGCSTDGESVCIAVSFPLHIPRA